MAQEQEQARQELLLRDRTTKQNIPYYVQAGNINLGDDEHYEGLPDKLAEMEEDIRQASDSWTPTDESIAKRNLASDVQDTLDLADSALQPDDLSPINAAIQRIDAAIDALTGTNDTTAAINTMREVTAFLANLNNTDTLVSKLAELSQAISAKQDTINDISTIRSGAAAGATALQPEDVDETPTEGSNKPVSSGGVYEAMQNSGGGGEQKSISILFIGNSLTQDAVAYLPFILKEIAPDLDFKFYIWYQSGKNLTQIYSTISTGGKAEIFSHAENIIEWTNSSNATTFATVLSTYTFDIVCLQEYFNYKIESNSGGQGYPSNDKDAYNDIISHIRNNYGHPFKVISLFHRPRVVVKETDAAGMSQLQLADEIFGLTHMGIRWQLQNTICEGMIPTGIACYRTYRDSNLNGLGTYGYMSYEGTHSQEGLPCLMQAWVTALWIFDHLGMPISINNMQGRVTSSNWSSISVPGANGSVVEGTAAQQLLAMDYAIKAFKEGKRIVNEALTAEPDYPLYKITINTPSVAPTSRYVALSASLTPAATSQTGITWSIESVTGTDVSTSDASINNGVLHYTGTDRTAQVTVKATSTDTAITATAVVTFNLPAVEEPTFSPAAGGVAAGTSVSISAQTGATIYYTTDGSTPTSSSTEYTSAITINQTTTIKAIAVKDGQTSEVASATYTVVALALVTVSVTSNSSALSGATVKLTDALSGDEYTDTTDNNGECELSVPENTTYSLEVSKTGFFTETQSLTVTTGTASASVALTEGIDVLVDQNAKMLLKDVTGTRLDNQAAITLQQSHYPNMIAQGNSDAGANISSNANRTGIAVDRSATNAVTWNIGTDDAKQAFSLMKWPDGYNTVKAKFTDSGYKFVFSCGDSNGYALSPTSWVTLSDLSAAGGWIVLTKAAYPSAVYLAVQVAPDPSGSCSDKPTIAQLGLEVIAVKDGTEQS